MMVLSDFKCEEWYPDSNPVEIKDARRFEDNEHRFSCISNSFTPLFEIGFTVPIYGWVKASNYRL